MSEQPLPLYLVNDLFRNTFLPIFGRVMLTPGAAAHPMREAAISAVRVFDQFTEDNDPYGEHDFGSFEIDHQRFYWKIDYYDQHYRNGSEDPTNPLITRRLLTIMLAEEY
tara:strand:- start:2051 stop:2380 length:330 start_codon:yes stop_codon:yes gene_type:complete